MPFLSLPKLHFAWRFEGFDVGFHAHAGHELLWVTHGPCRIAVGSHILKGDTDTLFILPARVPHNQMTESLVRTSYVVFGDVSESFNATPRAVQLEPDALAKRWMNDLCELSQGMPPRMPAVADTLVLALLEYLSDAEAQQDQTPLHPALRAALLWMETRLDVPLQIADLVAHTHFSSSHLSELFSRQFGCGPQAHHQKLRQQQAARLLHNPYLQVAEVGRRCGYSDPNFFTRQFQRHHGISPAKYRRRIGNPNG